ncbi:phage minor capsid protein [Nonomuraea sp. LPB2021202275-12-8]|uniref:phage minor capsid protein n=1 Tax=Nonomuraea sp. LPB2021202275-12-8 TaxID=3120159 RepID=UPI00300C61A1
MASRTVAPTTEDAQHALKVAEAIQQMYLDAEDSLFQSLADHLWRAARGAAVTEGRKKRLEAMRERLDRGDLTARQRRELVTDLRTLAAGGADPRMVRQYLERRSVEVKELRREAGRIIQRLERRAFPTLVEAVTAAWRRGVKSAIDDINDLGGKKGIPAGQGVVEMARQMITNLRKRHISALRTIDDQFQEVNKNAIGRALAGTESIDQVVERELKDYAKRGVTRFVDRAGKTWDLPTYAEMTARTSVIRAASDGHTRTLADNGHRFVIVSQDAITCPRCAPFEGEILAISDDGPTGEVKVTHFLSDEPMTIEVRATIEGARRLGLQHPNCGHTFGLYTPGVTQRPRRPESKATYEDAQHQRRLERDLRAAKRIAAVARTPTEQKDARAKAKRLSAELDELAESKGLPRRRRQERVRDLAPEEVEAARQSRIKVSRETRGARRAIERASQRTAAAGTRDRRPPPSTGSAPMGGGPDGGDDSPGGGGSPAGPRDGGQGPTPLQEARRTIDSAEQTAEDAGNRRSRPAGQPERDAEPEREPEGTPPPRQAARDDATQARARRAAQQAEPEQPEPSIWTRDLPDPAQRPSWYGQDELDDRQIITEPDGSKVVVVSGEVIGRVRQSQARPGQWLGQHIDRSQVSRRMVPSQEKAVDELIRQAQERWRKAHPDAPAPEPPRVRGDEQAQRRDEKERLDRLQSDVKAAGRARVAAEARAKEAQEAVDVSGSGRRPEDAAADRRRLVTAQAEARRAQQANEEAQERFREHRDATFARRRDEAAKGRTQQPDTPASSPEELADQISQAQERLARATEKATERYAKQEAELRERHARERAKAEEAAARATQEDDDPFSGGGSWAADKKLRDLDRKLADDVRRLRAGRDRDIARLPEKKALNAAQVARGRALTARAQEAEAAPPPEALRDREAAAATYRQAQADMVAANTARQEAEAEVDRLEREVAQAQRAAQDAPRGQRSRAQAALLQARNAAAAARAKARALAEPAQKTGQAARAAREALLKLDRSTVADDVEARLDRADDRNDYGSKWEQM